MELVTFSQEFVVAASIDPAGYRMSKWQLFGAKLSGIGFLCYRARRSRASQNRRRADSTSSAAGGTTAGTDRRTQKRN